MLYKNQKLDKDFPLPQNPSLRSVPSTGVSSCGRSTYQVTVQHKGKTYRAGLFRDEREAAKARDRLARQLHGPYARLNLPPEDPDTAGQ